MAYIFAELYEEFRSKLNFVSVYIAEAHAQDVWPISSARYNGERGPVLIPQPKSDVQRCALAAAYVRNFDYPMPVIVDPVTDDFERVFAPWPIRFYIVNAEGVLDYIPEPKNCEYSVEELRTAVSRHVRDDDGVAA